jgi:predicted nuclease of predicted toxin-antitoxin system
VKLRDLPLLTDENVDSSVVAHLRTLGFDVVDVNESGLQGSVDVDLLRLAVAQGRIIVTHDSDFGTLAIRQGEPIIGLVFLRPGHIDPRFIIETVETIIKIDPDITPPFILVAKRTGAKVAIRTRHLGP